MLPQNGSSEDQRIKAEMNARNATLQTPSFRGAGPQDTEERVRVFSNFNVGMVPSFVLAASSGKFPGNVQTDLPLWPAEMMQYFIKKYADWAPAPYSQLPPPEGPLDGLIGRAPGESPSAMIRITMIVSGMDGMQMIGSLGQSQNTHDQISATLHERDVERSFQLLYTKIWNGMPPISEAHWQAKGLDDEDKIEEALSILESVCDIFDYLRKPNIQGELRDMHNKAFVEFDVFQDACNALHATQGRRMPGYSLSKLWQEYVRLQFDFMTRQARAFLMTHLLLLQKYWKARLLEKIQSGRIINETQHSIIVDHQAIFVLNKIQDLYICTDLLLHTRTDGFFMAHGIHPSLARIDGPKATLDAAYASLEADRMGRMKAVINHVIDDRVTRRASMVPPEPWFMAPLSMVVDREFGHKALQPQLENPPTMKMEPWVSRKAEPSVETFGFLVYRLCYEESDEEWSNIKERITSEVQSSWEGVVGGEDVKRKAVLRWMDGRKANIEKGDLDGARAHFKSVTIPNAPNHIPKGLITTTCLAVTSETIASFKAVPNTTLTDKRDSFPGDFRPFIHVIDPTYMPDPTPTVPNPASTATEPQTQVLREERKHVKGYNGSFLIPLHLVYTELYALKSMIGGISQMDELSAIGMKHPWGVYVGPTTAITRRNWREMGTRGMAGVVIKAASEYKRSESDGDGRRSDIPIR